MGKILLFLSLEERGPDRVPSYFCINLQHLVGFLPEEHDGKRYTRLQCVSGWAPLVDNDPEQVIEELKRAGFMWCMPDRKDG